MGNPSAILPKVGRIFQIVLNFLLAVPAMGLGALTLYSPDAPAGALAENAVVGIALLGTAVILIFDVYRPFSGGVLLIVWAIAFAAIFNGFHLSEYVFTTRQVGYHTCWSGVTLILVLLGLFSLARAKFDRNES